MSDTETPLPEPTEVDERNAIALAQLLEEAGLRPATDGGDRCDTCLFYLNPGDALSYCWQPGLRILVDADWWCASWRPIPG